MVRSVKAQGFRFRRRARVEVTVYLTRAEWLRLAGAAKKTGLSIDEVAARSVARYCEECGQADLFSGGKEE